MYKMYLFILGSIRKNNYFLAVLHEEPAFYNPT